MADETENRFEETPRIAEMVAGLDRAVADLGRGDILPHEVIGEILRCDPNEDHWQWCMNKARRNLLRERGIVMRPVLGVGFRLLTEKETLEVVPRERLRRASRQIRRGRRELDALPTDNLSHRQRNNRLLLLRAMAEAASKVREQQRAESVANQRTVVNPKRFVPALRDEAQQPTA